MVKPLDLYQAIADKAGVTRQDAKVCAHKYMYSIGSKNLTLDELVDVVALELELSKQTKETGKK